MLDHDLATRHQDLVERQRGDIGPPGRAQRVSTRRQRATVASAFAGRLHQRDLTLARSFRAVPLISISDPVTSPAALDQRAGRHRPAVDVDEVRRRRIEHALSRSPIVTDSWTALTEISASP